MTKPGLSGMRGCSARRATSTPASTDSHRKCGSSASSLPKCRQPEAGGNRRRLVQVAPTQASAPMARSAGFTLCISSIQSRKNAAPRHSAVDRGDSDCAAGAGAGPGAHACGPSTPSRSAGWAVTVRTSIWLSRSNSLASARIGHQSYRKISSGRHSATQAPITRLFSINAA